MARVICPEPGCQLTLMSCTGDSIAPFTVRYQFMPLYGPQRWYDFEPQTQVRGDAASSEGEKK